MVILMLLAAISMVLSLLLTPMCRAVGWRLNVVDVPDLKRKRHRRSIPRTGGISVYLAYNGSLLIASALLPTRISGVDFGLSGAKVVVPAAALIFLVGFVDDVIGLKPWHKLLGEIFAGSLLVAAGVHFPYLAGDQALHWLVAGATIFWVVLCANAVNLIDGMDGLAAGVVLMACTTICAASVLSGHFELAIALVPLMGAIAGFLAFNFHPASVFLGDSGSLVLGFLLGCYSIFWVGNTTDTLAMVAPFIALAVPLLDTSIAILRRFLRRKPIFGADNAHIHHRLLARGFTPIQTTGVLYASAGIAGVLSLLLVNVRGPWQVMVIVACLCGTIVGVNQLGYVEFGAARRLVLNSSFRRTLNQQIALQNLEAELSKSLSPEDCWTVVNQSASQDFGFYQIRMQLAGQTYERPETIRSAQAWSIRFQISGDDWIELSHESGSKRSRDRQLPTGAVEFAETIRRVLGPGGPIFSRFPEKRSYSGMLANGKRAGVV